MTQLKKQLDLIMSEKVTKRLRKATQPELSGHVIGLHNVDEIISKITRREVAPQFLIVDLFCGAGGTSTGFEMAGDLALVIACVNHDYKAIISHWLNHPHVAHFEEDMRKLDLKPLIKLIEFYRSLYPDAIVILWASLECTNFSKAKGGQPRDADSRTLALHLFRYIKAIDPDFVQIENVVEFMAWGPMVAKITKTSDGFPCCEFQYREVNVPIIDSEGLFEIRPEDGSVDVECKLQPVFQGVPASNKNGQDWLRWRDTINKRLGFTDEWRQLNSANYGAYTSRNRLFGIFARPGLPIAWPEPTHAKKPTKHSIHGDLQKWMAVKDVLDFSDEGESIFNRKTPLVDTSLERIYAGLIRFVANGDTSFIAKYYSGKPSGKVKSIMGPASTVTTFNNQYLVQAGFIQQRHAGEPGSKLVDLNGPARTITSTGGNQDVVFLAHYYSNGGELSSIEEPSCTISTKDRTSVVSAQVQSIDYPAGTIMPNDKHRLIECQAFIMPTNYDNKPVSIDQPAPTITANRKYHYLVNPSHGGHCTSTDQPCPVIIARQDKAPLYLIQAEAGLVIIPVYEGDSPIMIKIKQFMAAFGIIDIKMRMLRVHELLRIQGFPLGYKLEGNQADQKKFIGNSVVPLVVKKWTEALGSRLIDTYNQKIA